MEALYTHKIGDVWVKVKQPEIPGRYPVNLLLHGWTGDENSMWVFTSRLPASEVYIAPRGIYPSPYGGFSWAPTVTKIWPSVADLEPAARILHKLLKPENFPFADFSNFNLIGFSQGAALGLTYLFYYPEAVKISAILSGFLPLNAEEHLQNPKLQNKPVFIAHGSQDELVPVDIARNMVDMLEKSGLQVVYCEETVGHKLSASCFRGLEAFFEQRGDC